MTGSAVNHKGKPAHETALPWPTRWLGWPAVRAADAITGACFGLRAAFWRRLLHSIHEQVEFLCANLTPKRNHRTLELLAIVLAAGVAP